MKTFIVRLPALPSAFGSPLQIEETVRAERFQVDLQCLFFYGEGEQAIHAYCVGQWASVKEWEDRTR